MCQHSCFTTGHRVTGPVPLVPEYVRCMKLLLYRLALVASLLNSVSLAGHPSLHAHVQQMHTVQKP